MTGPGKLTAPGQNRLVITPTCPSDLHTLSALFDRSSAKSRRERFHGTLRRIPCQYLYDVVYGAPGVVARVVRDLNRDPSGGCVIALATAVPESTNRAELAVWVEDAWQRRGIGTRAARAVLEQLEADGVRQAIAYLEPGNTAATALARSLAHANDATAPTGDVVTFQLTRSASQVAA